MCLCCGHLCPPPALPPLPPPPVLGSRCVRTQVGCSDDDDNNTNCVWYCVQWYVNIGYNCKPTEPHTFTSCEQDCAKYIADPDSPKFDGTIYAECMSRCYSS